MDAIVVGTDNANPNFQFKWPFLWNWYIAKIFWNRIAILFVPLATFDGRPKKISIGSVSIEPPAETILMKPTPIPTISMAKIGNISIAFASFRSEEHTSELQSRFDLV